MKTYAIYLDKKIRMFIGTTDESIVQANLQPDEQFIESTFDGDSSLYMVSFGKVIALSPRPEMGYEFNYDSLVWFNASLRSSCLCFR